IGAAFGSVALVGGDLLVTGALLAAADRIKSTGKKAAGMGVTGALIIGAAQAFAILPGISRSGTTICVALFLGLDRKEAARFSFLLAIPAIAGAAVLKLKDTLDAGADVNLVVVASGMTVAFVSGLLALQWLIHVLNKGKLLGFAIYCWVIGVSAIAGAFIFL
ncbi:undecaprenyl-diphosphate phosphatase, partial [bacterium]